MFVAVFRLVKVKVASNYSLQMQLMKASGYYLKVTARATLTDPIENDATLYKTTVFMSALHYNSMMKEMNTQHVIILS